MNLRDHSTERTDRMNDGVCSVCEAVESLNHPKESE